MVETDNFRCEINSALEKEVFTFTPYISGSVIKYQNCYRIGNDVHVEVLVERNTAANIMDYSFICSAPVKYRPKSAKDITFICQTSGNVTKVTSAFVSADTSRNLTWIKAEQVTANSAFIFGDYSLI